MIDASVMAITIYGMIAGVIITIIVYAPLAMCKARQEVKRQMEEIKLHSVNIERKYNYLEKHLDEDDKKNHFEISHLKAQLDSRLSIENFENQQLSKEIIKLKEEIIIRDKTIACVSSRVIEIIEAEKCPTN